MGKVGNQPKLIKYYNNENIQIEILMGLEANLNVISRLIMATKKNFKELLLDIEEITKLINEEMKK